MFRCGSCNSDVYYVPEHYSGTMSQSNFQQELYVSVISQDSHCVHHVVIELGCKGGLY